MSPESIENIAAAPNSKQTGCWRRLLHEPKPPEVLQWVHDNPTGTLLRYHGIFNSERVLVLTPKAMSEVFSSRNDDYEKPAGIRKVLEMLLGDGLINSEGAAHKNQRSALHPAFHVRRIKALYPTIWSKACNFTNALADSMKDTQVLDINDAISAVMLDIICSAGIGSDLDIVNHPHSDFAQKYRNGFAASPEARRLHLMALLLPPWSLDYIPGKRTKEVHGSAKAVRAHCRNVVRERLVDKKAKDKQGNDILSVILDTASFSEEELVDQCMTLLGAGHETTASAVTSALYLLCTDPSGMEMQRRLRDEVRSKLPSPSGTSPEISPDQLESLPYLTAICNEVLRVRSPVPLVWRTSIRPTIIDNVAIPTNTRICLPPWGINKSRTLWGDEAENFDPDRWLGRPAGGAESNYAFLTFSGGKRSCIGAGFARAEMAACLAALFGRFEVGFDHVGDTEYGLTVNFEGLWVKLTQIDGW
ncbi:cytochrome P450 monooxygenase [Myriangium duriaei CBS 260.36]|uniref:Cytochrome P450 monooxygenase n=1 Tax=Myriangium duriaei CBS 260.36 TaxID=1168546 RepID=A0A9P4MIY9_9PEZI|nr:cytochrome P450 monooxygenase [Myriangium duriaei CBS 260.36]